MKRLLLIFNFLLFTLVSQAQNQLQFDESSPLEISDVQPKDNEVIEQTELTGILIWAFVRETKHVDSVEFIVNNTSLTAHNTSEGDVFTAPWTPSAYGTYTFKIIATNKEGIISESETSFTIKDKLTTLCDGSIEWSNIAYTTAGTEVSYNGKIYKNRWYAEPTEIPGISNVWKYDRPCNKDSSAEYCGILPWSSSITYDKGDKTYYKQKIYKAKWWTQNNIPNISNAWQYESDCSAETLNILSSRGHFSIEKNIATMRMDSQQSTMVKIEIYDLSGTLIRTIMNKKISDTSQVIHKDMSDLENGFYIYKINVDGNIYTGKVIKE